jgi:hypothetical protein
MENDKFHAETNFRPQKLEITKLLKKAMLVLG